MRVVSISSLKGGVGKTTVALGLASAGYASHLRILVIDMDPQCDATTGLGIEFANRATIADLLHAPRGQRLRSLITPSRWTAESADVVDVVPGSPDSVNYDEPHPRSRDIGKLDEALADVEDAYDLVIIDCPPSLNALTQTAWAASDDVLIVSEPGLFSLAAAARAVRAVKDTNADRHGDALRTAGIVINRFRPQSVEHQYRVDEIKDMFGDLVLPVRLPERASIQQPQGAARPIHSWPGESTQEVAHLFDRLLQIILDKDAA